MAEKEYIERGALIEKMFPIGMPNNGKYPINAKAVRTAIEQVPAADVVEVRHGKWLSVEGDVLFECSICGTEVSTSWDYDDPEMFRYCPCCGAKMDGERKEQK